MSDWEKCRICKRPVSDKAKLGIGRRCWEKKVRGCPKHGEAPFWWKGGQLFTQCQKCAQEENNDGLLLVWAKIVGHTEEVYRQRYQTNKEYYQQYYQQNCLKIKQYQQQRHLSLHPPKNPVFFSCVICCRPLKEVDRRQKTCSGECVKILHKRTVNLYCQQNKEFLQKKSRERYYLKKTTNWLKSQSNFQPEPIINHHEWN